MEPPLSSPPVLALVPTFTVPTSSSQSSDLAAEPEWTPIFHASESNQVVLYNPTSHALAIQNRSSPSPLLFPDRQRPNCPYCKQVLPAGFQLEADNDEEHEHGQTNRASNYFQLLAIANETASGPSTPQSSGNFSRASRRHSPSVGQNGAEGSRTFPAEVMAEGYFGSFFQEECKLGMGAYGSVYLCQVRLTVFCTSFLS